MDPKAFQTTTSGRVIRVGQGQAAYWAFVPNPLPPRLAIDWELASLNARAERAVGELAGLGRMGRLLLSLLLVGWKLLPLPLLHLSAYFEENRQAYYDLLLATSQRGAWREWLDYFLKGVIAQSQDTIQRIKRLQDLQRQWHNILQMAKGSGSTHRLADYLFEVPMITIPQAQRILEMKTHRGAKLVVEKLAELGLIVPIGGRAYGKNYLARDILLEVFAERNRGK